VGCKALSCYLALNDTVISKIRVRIAKFPEYRTALVSATVIGKIDVRARRAASAGFDNRSQIDEHYMARHRQSSSTTREQTERFRSLSGSRSCPAKPTPKARRTSPGWSLKGTRYEGPSPIICATASANCGLSSLVCATVSFISFMAARPS